MSKQKLLVCGDRNWIDEKTIKRILKKAKKAKFNTIVEGEANGADKLSAKVGEDLGFKIKRYPANWEKYGRAAGPIRNAEMLKKNPDIEMGIAFHDHITHSKGTIHMIKLLNKAGILVAIIPSERG